MPVSKEQVLSTIYESIGEVNDQFSLNVLTDETTPLIGDNSGLDSLGFVNFIASLEDKCQQRFGLQLSLTDGSGNSEAAHLHSVNALAAYILQKYDAR
jgi:acyl carrier protein